MLFVNMTVVLAIGDAKRTEKLEEQWAGEAERKWPRRAKGSWTDLWLRHIQRSWGSRPEQWFVKAGSGRRPIPLSSPVPHRSTKKQERYHWLYLTYKHINMSPLIIFNGSWNIYVQILRRKRRAKGMFICQEMRLSRRWRGWPSRPRHSGQCFML